MPRVTITPTSVVAGKEFAPTDIPINTNLVQNGATIPCKGEIGRLRIQVFNMSGGPKTITFKASTKNTTDVVSQVDRQLYVHPPTYYAFAANRGDLTISIPNNSIYVIMGLESARFTQGENLWMDFETGMTGTIAVELIPKAL